MFVSIIFRLFRFRPEEFEDASVERVLEVVPMKSDEEEFSAALTAGDLFDLGQEWEVVHAAFTGGSQDVREPEYQAVLGGDLFGRTETEILVSQTPADVRTVARYLSGLDSWHQVIDNRAAMEAAHGGEISDNFAHYVASRLDGLSAFYAEAAMKGDVVVKIAYS
ncbi:DUF1877 family protein [Streptomyces sp. NPDC059460]|uniref:DUF1877 family protein n=1 Tax=Streptomyces sp. NPDC059460 TaxID=3346840 RepID=UPI00367AC215